MIILAPCTGIRDAGKLVPLSSHINGYNYVAVEILDVHLHPIRDREETILFYIERTSLTIVSLLVRYTMEYS